MKPLLELKGIYKSFKTEQGFLNADATVHACEDIHLQLYKGQVLGLVGESGSGKSTLGKIIVRLIQEDQGRIFFEGTDITRLKGKALQPYRKELQLIFQNTALSLNPVKKIGWLLKESLDINTTLTEAEKKYRVAEVMEMVGLQETLINRTAKELSGGERQRACMAIALMLNPKVIVADEAVSALDVSVSAQILNLMNDLKDRLGLSYIFISHDLKVVHYISDTIGVMKDGRLIEYGQAQDLFTNPREAYTKTLLEAALLE